MTAGMVNIWYSAARLRPVDLYAIDLVRTCGCQLLLY